MNTQLKTPTRANLSRTGRMMQIAAEHYQGKQNIPEPVKAVIQNHKLTRLSPTHLAQILQGRGSKQGGLSTAESLVQTRFKTYDRKIGFSKEFSPSTEVILKLIAAKPTRQKALYHASEDHLRVSAANNLSFQPDNSNAKIYKWHTIVGSDLSNIAAILVDQARYFGITQETVFNGIALTVTPNDTKEKIITRYQKADKERWQRYLKSPEHLASQEAQRQNRIQQAIAQKTATELVSGRQWDPTALKDVDDTTPFILRALLKIKYPDGTFAEDHLMYMVKDQERADEVSNKISSSIYGPTLVGDTNKLVLVLELALENGYQPSKSLINAALEAIDVKHSGWSQSISIQAIIETWVHGEVFRTGPDARKPMFPGTTVVMPRLDDTEFEN